MATETLTERERQTIEHLRHAQELGSSLTDYAQAFSLNVSDICACKAQLQRKGLWPVKNADGTKPELLAVRVSSRTPSEAIVCCLKAPSGWVIECGAWPEPAWIARLITLPGEITT
jgi:hypothetical protein